MPVVKERLRDDPDRVGEVDQPGPAIRAAGRFLGDLEHHRNGPQRLGKPAGAGRLLAHATEPRRDRLVQEAGGLAADPELDHDEVGAVERGRAIQRGRHAARPSAPGENPAGQPGHDLQSLGIDIEEDELVDGQACRARREPLHELGGVRAAAADDGDLQAHDSTSRSWVTAGADVT